MSLATVSTDAKHGLEISPVVVDLAGRSGDEVEMIGRGSYLVNSVAGCNTCHGSLDGKFLAGGIPFPISATQRVFARNLTPDATGLKLTEAEFVEALRTGKDFKNNDQLIVMPWRYFRWMSDRDIKSIYAYLKAVPPVNSPIPDDIKGALSSLTPEAYDATKYTDGATDHALPPATQPDPGNALRGLAIQPFDTPASVANLSAEDQAAYARGSYLVNSAGNCSSCHTNPDRNPAGVGKVNTAAYLSGGGLMDLTAFGVDGLFKLRRTLSSNLSGNSHGYKGTLNDFVASMTAGKPAFPHPPTIGAATLEDLTAMYVYIKNVPKVIGANDKTTQAPSHLCAADADCADFGGKCDVAGKECVGKTCVTAGDCDACQTCSATKCVAADPAGSCATSGL